MDYNFLNQIFLCVVYVGVGGGGGVGTLGGGGGVVVRNWTKLLFLGPFWKNPTYCRPWMNVFVRVLQKVAKIRVIIYKI